MRAYELTEAQWNRIKDLLLSERKAQGTSVWRYSKQQRNRTLLQLRQNGWFLRYAKKEKALQDLNQTVVDGSGQK